MSCTAGKPSFSLSRFQASRDGKIVGSPDWLLHVLHTRELSSPKASLLHYPVPLEPIEGMSSFVITVTNYSGRIREYLKRLIQVAGATYMPTMSSRVGRQPTTHLICGKYVSDANVFFLIRDIKVDSSCSRFTILNQFQSLFPIVVLPEKSTRRATNGILRSSTISGWRRAFRLGHYKAKPDLGSQFSLFTASYRLFSVQSFRLIAWKNGSTLMMIKSQHAQTHWQ